MLLFAKAIIGVERSQQQCVLQWCGPVRQGSCRLFQDRGQSGERRGNRRLVYGPRRFQDDPGVRVLQEAGDLRCAEASQGQHQRQPHGRRAIVPGFRQPSGIVKADQAHHAGVAEEGIAIGVRTQHIEKRGKGCGIADSAKCQRGLETDARLCVF